MPTFKKTEPKKVNPLSRIEETNQPQVQPVIKNQPAQPKVNMNTSVLKPINSKPTISYQDEPKKGKKIFTIIGVFLIIILGIGSGYGLTIMTNGTSSVGGLKEEKGLKREVESSEIVVGTKVGVADESTFKDSAEGSIEKGGLDGEGSHKLIRPGGESQTIYLTSSVIDLDQFDGRKVKIWGETFSSQKAGWLMDVGKLEVLE